jgi:hypothetical protein
MPHALSKALEHLVAEHFAPADQSVALMLLARYGSQPDERDVDRVRRALVVLGRGDIGLLGHYLAAAQHDRRDVLYWADHPEQAPKR